MSVLKKKKAEPYAYIQMKKSIKESILNLNFNERVPQTTLMVFISRFLIKYRDLWREYYDGRVEMLLEEENKGVEEEDE